MLIQRFCGVARTLHHYPSLWKILIHIIRRETLAEYTVILYYGLNCIPSKRYIEVLTPGTSEFDLSWKHG